MKKIKILYVLLLFLCVIAIGGKEVRAVDADYTLTANKLGITGTNYNDMVLKKKTITDIDNQHGIEFMFNRLILNGSDIQTNNSNNGKGNFLRNNDPINTISTIKITFKTGANYAPNKFTLYYSSNEKITTDGEAGGGTSTAVSTGFLSLTSSSSENVNTFEYDLSDKNAKYFLLCNNGASGAMYISTIEIFKGSGTSTPATSVEQFKQLDTKASMMFGYTSPSHVGVSPKEIDPTSIKYAEGETGPVPADYLVNYSSNGIVNFTAFEDANNNAAARVHLDSSSGLRGLRLYSNSSSTGGSVNIFSLSEAMLENDYKIVGFIIEIIYSQTSNSQITLSDDTREIQSEKPGKISYTEANIRIVCDNLDTEYIKIQNTSGAISNQIDYSSITIFYSKTTVDTLFKITDNSPSLRFGALLPADIYNGISNENQGVNIRYGVEINGEEVSDVNFTPVKVNEQGIADASGTFYQFALVITEIPMDKLHTELTAKVFVEIDGEKTYMKAKTISFVGVAQAYLNSEDQQIKTLIQGHEDVLDYIVSTYGGTN